MRFQASSRSALKESWVSMWCSPGVVFHAKGHSLKVITKFKRNCQFNSLKLYKENPIKKTTTTEQYFLKTNNHNTLTLNSTAALPRAPMEPSLDSPSLSPWGPALLFLSLLPPTSLVMTPFIRLFDSALHTHTQNEELAVKGQVLIRRKRRKLWRLLTDKTFLGGPGLLGCGKRRLGVRQAGEMGACLKSHVTTSRRRYYLYFVVRDRKPKWVV